MQIGPFSDEERLEKIRFFLLPELKKCVFCKHARALLKSQIKKKTPRTVVVLLLVLFLLGVFLLFSVKRESLFDKRERERDFV